MTTLIKSKSITEIIDTQINEFEDSQHSQILLTDCGKVSWNGGIIASLTKGDHIMHPDVQVYDSCFISPDQQDRIKTQLSTWIRNEICLKLTPLVKIERADTDGMVKEVVQHIIQNLGVVSRNTIGHINKSLSLEDQQELKKLGVHLAFKTIFISEILKPASARLRFILWCLFHELTNTSSYLPPSGLMSFPKEENVQDQLYHAAGYRVCGVRAIRVDILERLAFEAYKLTKDGAFIAPPEMAATVGCKRDELPLALESIGYTCEEIETDTETDKVIQYKFTYKPQRKPKKIAPSNNSPHKTKKNYKKAAAHTSQKVNKKKPVEKKLPSIDPDNPFASLMKLKLK